MPATAAAPAGMWSTAVAATSPYSYPIDRTISPTELGVSYDFQIRATNATGNGPWSDFASGTAADLPDAVLGTNIEVIGANRSLVVTWTPAVNNGADIIDYSVRWAVNRTGNELWASKTVTASALPTTVLSGLTNGEPYVIGITARNSVGSSGETQTTTNPSPAGAVAGPSTVTAVANPTKDNTTGNMIDVTWSAVPNVAAYRVEYLDVTSNPTRGWQEVAPTGTSISTVPIEGTSTNSPTGTMSYFNAAATRSATITVTPDTTYVVRVLPVTQPLVGGLRMGDGIEGTPGFSAPVKAEATPATAVTHTDGTTTNIDGSATVAFAQPTKTTTVRVTWAVNAANAEAEGVTGYMVTWYPTSSTVAGNRGNATVAAAARSFDITGLTAIGQQFTVIVSPVNKIGVGAPATGTHTLTPATT
ncbi:MAG: fibronectin type III domain-containing protein [Acidimicrobiia bacterium]|nr:fibronectin type III domain-containing protein [Acidimicrobiia bacterium]